MPFMSGAALGQLAKMNFTSKGTALPVQWEKPEGTIRSSGSEMFTEAFPLLERIVPPNAPTNLFREPTLNRYHVGSAGKIGGLFADYIDGICKAISGGISMWLPMTVVNVSPIIAITGMLTPGGVVGPPLMPLILASGAPMSTPMEIKYSTAIANAVGTGWQMWHSTLLGTVMFSPDFAVFPGPFHPPTPNIPMPIITLSSPGESMLSPSALGGAMMANLGDPKALHAKELFDSVAGAFDTAFLAFKAATLLNNVMGMGPIPTFAPPVVPVGPVMGGFGIGVGCLS